MARSLVLGNGTFLVTLDQYGFVRDVHYPYVGLDNHVSGNKHRIGIEVNGEFHWLDDETWDITLGYKPESMIGYLRYKSEKLNISIVAENAVYNETTIFLRKLQVYNHRDEPISVKVFFHQVFIISESKKRNTGFYDPTASCIVHYKGRRVFLVDGMTESGESMDDFCVGQYQFEGKEGTWRDAEDGVLGKNGVDHGSVDSVIRFSFMVGPREKNGVYYWFCAGHTLEEAYKLNHIVSKRTPSGMLHSTEAFWRAWLQERKYPLECFDEPTRRLFENSLFVLRAHVDNRGSIIASADSEMIEYGKDDYSYMWPRDAAYIASILDQAGFNEVTKPFYKFCSDVLHPDGYLHHRFNADQSLGSTWHLSLAQDQWLKDKILQLPIQEDETAGVIWALWKHYTVTKDVEFIENLFKPFIEPAADFLLSFRDSSTGLPLSSYDLWEEKIGVSTYTCAAVYGALMAAVGFADLLGKRNHRRRYVSGANEIKEAALKYLYSPRLNAFARCGRYSNGSGFVLEEVVDSSSLFGLWYYEMLPQDHPYLMSTVQEVERRLKNPGATGGFIRYENDSYFRSGTLSNPWIITTLWEAQRRLKSDVVSPDDLKHVEDTIQWVVKQTLPSGVLPEQMDPETGRPLSATPLAWSHAVFVETILWYMKHKCPAPSEPAPTTSTGWKWPW